jgi:hypothetical protein
MMQKAITLAEELSTNPLVFMYFFGNKYFMQPGGQVHFWDPPEFAIKKTATWDPSNEGFATFFARMTTSHLGEPPAGKARRRSQRRLLRAFGIRQIPTRCVISPRLQERSVSA